MSGPWLLSYLVLWLSNTVLIIVMVGVVRQIGVLHLKIAKAQDSLQSSSGGQSTLPQGIMVGKPAPEFAGKNVLTGKSISSHDLNDTGALLIFIAPTCSLCQALIPAANAFPSHEGRPLVVFVSQGGRYRTKEFTKLFRVIPPVIADRKGEISRSYEISRSPTVVAVDSNGTIAGEFMQATEEDLRVAWNLLVSAKPEQSALSPNGIARSRALVEEVQ